MRKKAAGLFLSVLLCAGLLAGCGKSDDTAHMNSNTPAPNTEAAEETTEAEPPQDVQDTQTPEEEERNAEDVPTIGDRTNIYVIVPANSGASGREAAAIQSAGEAAGYTILVREHEGNVETQQGFFDEAMADDNAAAIICDHAGADQTTTMVAGAKAKGVPTVLINTGIDVEGSAIAQILTNAYASATDVSKQFIDHMSGTGRYVELLGSTENINAYNATTAFHDVVSEYDMLMDRQEVGNEYDLEGSQDLITKMLSESTDSTGLVCYSSIQAQAGVNAADALGRDISILCLNGDDSTEELIKSGAVYAAVMKPAETLGDKAIKEVIQYLEEGSTGQSEMQYEKGEVVTADTIG